MASMKAWSSAARELAATRRDCRVAWAAKTGERVSGTQIRPENVALSSNLLNFRESPFVPPTRTRYQAAGAHAGGRLDGAVNVKKPGSSEPGLWVRLFRIEPRRHGG